MGDEDIYRGESGYARVGWLERESKERKREGGGRSLGRLRLEEGQKLVCEATTTTGRTSTSISIGYLGGSVVRWSPKAGSDRVAITLYIRLYLVCLFLFFFYKSALLLREAWKNEARRIYRSSDPVHLCVHPKLLYYICSLLLKNLTF